MLWTGISSSSIAGVSSRTRLPALTNVILLSRSRALNQVLWLSVFLASLRRLKLDDPCIGEEA